MWNIKLLSISYGNVQVCKCSSFIVAKCGPENNTYNFLHISCSGLHIGSPIVESIHNIFFVCISNRLKKNASINEEGTRVQHLRLDNGRRNYFSLVNLGIFNRKTIHFFDGINYDI